MDTTFLFGALYVCVCEKPYLTLTYRHTVILHILMYVFLFFEFRDSGSCLNGTHLQFMRPLFASLSFQN